MGGYKKWNTNDVLTASNLNEYVGSQVVTVFATTAARDAAITGANLIDGMVCYVASNNSSEGLYTYNGSNWRKGPGWNAPWGLLSSTSDTTDRVRTTTMAELATGLRTSTTIIGNRWLRFTFVANVAEASSGGGFVAEVYDNTAAATAGRIAQVYSTIDAGYQISNSIVVQSTAAAVYTIRMQGITHSVNVYGSTVGTTRFFVEDIGPSGAPL